MWSERRTKVDDISEEEVLKRINKGRIEKSAGLERTGDESLQKGGEVMGFRLGLFKMRV